MSIAIDKQKIFIEEIVSTNFRIYNLVNYKSKSNPVSVLLDDC